MLNRALRRRALTGSIVAVAASGCLAFAGSADANTYCAVTSTSPTIPGVTCTSTSTENSPAGTRAVAAALSAASSNPGADTVAIGAGSFTTTSGSAFTVSTTGNNPLVIRGQGATTILNANAPPQATAVLSLASTNSADIFTVENLSVVIPDGSMNVGGIRAAGPEAATLRNVSVTAAGTNVKYAPGIEVDDGDLVTNSSVVLPIKGSSSGAGANYGAVLDGSSPAVQPVLQDSSVVADLGVINGDLSSGPTGTKYGKVLRDRINAVFGVATILNGGLDAEDTLIKLAADPSPPAPPPPMAGIPPGYGGPAGLFTYGFSSTTATITAKHVTVIGGTAQTDSGVYATGSGGSTSISISDSIFANVDQSLTRLSTSGSTQVNIAIAYSDYDPSKTGSASLSPNPGGNGTITQGSGNVNVDPQFTNAATGDYSLALGSPLIDAGTPGPLGAGESATDLLGNPRILDGNGDLASIRDMGAFEHATVNPPPPPPPDPPPPGGDTTPPDTLAGKFSHKTRGRKLTVRFSSTEDGSTFTCKLDKAAAKPCASPYRLKGLKRGRHTLLVTAIDAAGNADLSPATLRFKVLKPKKKRHHLG